MIRQARSTTISRGMWVVVENDKMHVQAGAGIVYDSDPQSEFEETQNKAMALIRAAGEALRFIR